MMIEFDEVGSLVVSLRILLGLRSQQVQQVQLHSSFPSRAQGRSLGSRK